MKVSFLKKREVGQIQIQSLDQNSVDKINEVWNRKKKWHMVFWIGLLIWILSSAIHPIIGAIVFVFYMIALYRSIRADRKQRIVLMNYPVDVSKMEKFEELVNAFVPMSASQKVYMVTSSTDVQIKERRRQAGASQLISRKNVKTTLSGPKNIISNIKVPTLDANVSVSFFPDAVMIIRDNNIFAVEYGMVRADASTTRFIESGVLYPKDAPVVDQTWQHVNKNGTPDKRVKNNRRLPVLRYDELELDVSGVGSFVYQISAPGTVDRFVLSISKMEHSNVAPL